MYYEFAIEEFSNKLLLVRIMEKSSVKTSEYSVFLAFENLKSEKNEQVIKACTEVGISEFFVFNSSRSVSLIKVEKIAKKLDCYAKITKSAAMQFGSSFILRGEIC